MGWTHRLFGLCEHRWLEKGRAEMTRVKDDAIVGWAVECKCEKCGVPRLFILKQ